MRVKIVAVLMVYAILFEISALSSLRVVNGAGDSLVDMRVEQVVWGTSPDNPITVSPGDVDVPLTVIVRNLAENRTIKGMYANLLLGYPFKSFEGELKAEAVGEPREEDLLTPRGEVAAAGSFSLTFRLNIDQDARKGNYYYNMTVYYMVSTTYSAVTGTYAYTNGTAQRLTVKLSLPNRAPVIDSFAPMQTNPTVYVGDSLNFSSRCHDLDGDNLTFSWVRDGEIVSNLTLYIFQPTIQDVGTHTVELRVSDGNLTASQVWNVLVDKLRTTEVILRDNSLIGGSNSLLNMTIKNNVWKGTVQIGISADQPPSAEVPPLVIYGNRSWIFTSIQPGDQISIYPEIYAPSSYIGMTYPATLTVAYSDEYGRSYTDTMSVGFVIRGLIRLILYDLKVSPNPIPPGSTFTLSAIILNKGNIPAGYVNASISSGNIVDTTRDRSSYIGEVAVNTPVPFSVVAKLSPEIGEGNYTLIINILYEDDLHYEHSLSNEFPIRVAKVQEEPITENETDNIFGLPFDAILILATLAFSSVALYILFRQIRKRSTKVTINE